MNPSQPVPPAPRRVRFVARPWARRHSADRPTPSAPLAVRLGRVAHVAPILAAVLADFTGKEGGR